MRGAGGTARHDMTRQGREGQGARHRRSGVGGRPPAYPCLPRSPGRKRGSRSRRGFGTTGEAAGTGTGGRRWPFTGAWRRVTSSRLRGAGAPPAGEPLLPSPPGHGPRARCRERLRGLGRRCEPRASRAAPGSLGCGKAAPARAAPPLLIPPEPAHPRGLRPGTTQ
ncbi:unnamed protein product [Coccothraustes coccothraustes]